MDKQCYVGDDSDQHVEITTMTHMHAAKVVDMVKCDRPAQSRRHAAITIERNIMRVANCHSPFANKNDNLNPLDACSEPGDGKQRSINSDDHDDGKKCSPLAKSIKKCVPSSVCLGRLITSLFPILTWLPSYSIGRDLISDLIAGFTIFALNVPQGLSYGKLAGGDPINGVYLGIWPVIIYALMGTSRHISIGTFAVISIACKEAVNKFDYSALSEVVMMNSQDSNATTIGASLSSHLAPMAPIDVLTSLCLLVGIIQFTLGSFRLGILAMLLSDTLISAFVVGSACHVFTSQIFSILGLSPSKTAHIDHILDNIPFALVRIYASIFLRLSQINWMTVAISVVTIMVLVLVKYSLEPYLAQRFKLKNLALPIDIVMIILLTVVSAQFKFKENYNVFVTPKIPQAFEDIPKVPRVDLFPQLIANAMVVAFIAYVTTYSLGKMYEKQYRNYQVSANQELLALGSANMLGSFLQCYPCCGSLARSAVQGRLGRTQLASLVSVTLIVAFLLFFSKYLATLPQCVLASTIVVALTSTLRKFQEFAPIWKRSRLDGLVWLATFAFVILLGVANGLIYGLVVSLVLLLFQLCFPTINFKRPVLESEIYVNIKNHPIHTKLVVVEKAEVVVVIFDFQGPLVFINSSIFESRFQERIMPEVVRARQHCQLNFAHGHVRVIFDCGRLTHLDHRGTEALRDINNQLAKEGDLKQVQLLLANLNANCLQTMQLCQFFECFHLDRCFMSVHDAFVSATNKTF